MQERLSQPLGEPENSAWPSRRRSEPQLPAMPVLRFTPAAWAKLHFFCHCGDTEIGGFGITALDDPLLVREFVSVKQRTTAVTVEFENAAVADFFDAQVDLGRRPEQFARVWLHTHPGDSPTPSSVDEGTFARVFGGCQWAVMFVLARSGDTFARLRFNVGPGGQVLIPVRVDWSQPFSGSDRTAWRQEYDQNVQIADWAAAFAAGPAVNGLESFLDEHVRDGLLSPAERQQILAEERELALAGQSELWVNDD